MQRLQRIIKYSLAILFIVGSIKPSFALKLYPDDDNNVIFYDPGEEEEVSITGCLTGVPQGLAEIFIEAGKAFNIPPALIAAIYLTEKHSNVFPQKPIDSNTIESPCVTSGAGAKGPCQIMPSEWKNFVNLVQSGKIPNYKHKDDPNICRYYDSFFASAMVINAKLTEQKDTNRNCCGGKKPCTERVWSDECIKSIGRAYCGCCTCTGCGGSKYDYCAEVLRHYKELSAPCENQPGAVIDVPCIKEDASGHCGRASAAMVFAFYTGKIYSTTQWGQMGGTQVLNQRLKENGINVQYVSSNQPAKNDNWQKIMNSLKNKHPVIYFSRGFYKSGGAHIFVIVGYDAATDTFIVNNPGTQGCDKGVKDIWGVPTTKTNMEKYADSQGGYYYYVP